MSQTGGTGATGTGWMARTGAPADPGVTGLTTVLDAAAMRDFLSRSLPTAATDGGAIDATIGAVAPVSVRYKPGRRAIVRYDIDVEGTLRIASAWAGAGAPGPTGPGRTYFSEIHTVVQWYPDDALLPGLRGEGWEAICAACGTPGADSQVLAYKPYARAVLRVGGQIVKVYADDRHYEAAANALAAVVASGGVPTAPLTALLPEHRATVQTALDAARADRERDAELLGSLLRRLHRTTVPGLNRAPVTRVLDLAVQAAELIATLLPDEAVRARNLIAALRAGVPAALADVTSHGDFEAGQVLVGPALADGAAIIDLDDVCLAPAARDIANYAVHLVRGDGRALPDATRALAALLRGYGTTPPGLSWHLGAAALARTPVPFRKFDPQWPQRMTEMLGAAEAFVHGGIAP